MSTYNIEMNMLNNSNGYDVLYPKTDYNQLINKPTIPDTSNFVTNSQLNSKGYVTSPVSISEGGTGVTTERAFYSKFNLLELPYRYCNYTMVQETISTSVSQNFYSGNSGIYRVTCYGLVLSYSGSSTTVSLTIASDMQQTQNKFTLTFTRTAFGSNSIFFLRGNGYNFYNGENSINSSRFYCSSNADNPFTCSFLFAT